MAHQMLKPYNLLLYPLAIIAAFFVGASYAGIVEAGKNQGLAGGAIVLGYGVIASVIGFVIALIVANKVNRKTTIWINIILALSIVGFYIYFHLKFLERKKAREEQAAGLYFKKPLTVAVHENKPFYFYGNLNLEKSLLEHLPTDSITFKRLENGGFDIATAPPWLVPAHLKLDYDILYFKVMSVTEEFVELEVNTQTKQTAFANKRSGKLMYWPTFLFSINSVEFLNHETQKVYVKPIDHASTVIQSYSFMRPLKIKQHWMYVLLKNDDFNTVGKGWIKWNDNGKLLISYSLLS